MIKLQVFSTNSWIQELSKVFKALCQISRTVRTLLQETILHLVVTKQPGHQDTHRHNTEMHQSSSSYFTTSVFLKRSLVLQSSARTFETPRTIIFQEATYTAALKSPFPIWRGEPTCTLHVPTPSHPHSACGLVLQPPPQPPSPSTI